MASLGHTGRQSVVLGHTLNTLQHIITKESHNVLSKFTILCWATFIAILGCVWPVGHRLDAPVRDPGEGDLNFPRSSVLVHGFFSYSKSFNSCLIFHVMNPMTRC